MMRALLGVLPLYIASRRLGLSRKESFFIAVFV